MRLSKGLLAAFAALLLAVVAAPAEAAQLKPPHVTYLGAGGTKNYTRAKRAPTSIHWIVIHVTEGGFAGTIAWLRNPASHASANFVVSRAGKIVELVPKRDIAWQAGNWAVNRQSVGIEHVGLTDSPTGFTDLEYRASAHLAAYIARTALMPIDREHIIGHYQVPDPNDPLLGGGIDNHTDPGRFWNWRKYLRLVRSYAYPPVVHHHVGLGIDSSTLAAGQVVAGTVPWKVEVSGPVSRVDFLVDGKVRWQDHRAPFAYAGGRGLSSRSLANGRHRLEVRAYGRGGHWTRDRFAIGVRNIRFTVAVSGLRPQQKVAGTVHLQALPNGTRPVRVALLLDGQEIDHDTSLPFAFVWDTTRVADGRHVVTLVARARGALVARSSVAVVVQNQAPIVQWQLPVQAQIVDSPVTLTPQVEGAVARTDYLLDGNTIATVTAAPWTWTWDPSAVPPGLHQLTVRATGPNGRTDTATIDVVVRPPGG